MANFDAFFKNATRSNQAVEDKSNWCRFKSIADNIDKNIHPRFQCHENRGQSLHHFHGYAIHDYSTLSNVAPTQQKPDPSTLLPSKEDMSSLNDELTVLISRYAMESIPFF